MGKMKAKTSVLVVDSNGRSSRKEGIIVRRFQATRQLEVSTFSPQKNKHGVSAARRK